MLKKETDMNDLISDALKESKIYLDMYNDRLKKCEEDLKRLEDNRENYKIINYKY